MKLVQLMTHESIINPYNVIFNHDIKELPKVRGTRNKSDYPIELHPKEFMSEELINALCKLKITKSNKINWIKIYIQLAQTILALQKKEYQFKVEMYKRDKKKFLITNLTLNTWVEINFK